ncbi:TolC family protein [Variovorax sp. OV329]|uniref:TolC family protein n=1 Tax=Variovorax sp. OV329 TaxID=1882825 RepID=UPI0008E1A04E|nr:TolC family protein [Variovorax sp. OV329]SFM20415.1 efflux transporter, outer membrane factor (OMF) lipoprotein, NodT family [Variovorax sp. OV329]
MTSRPWLRWLGLVAAALLAACTSVSAPPAMPDDAAVNKPAAHGAFMDEHHANVAQEPVPNDWWHLYDSRALDELVQQALAANTDLRVAAANLQKAQAALDLAGAAQEPTTSLSANTGFARRSAQEELHPGKPLPSKWVYGAGFGVSYQLDLFGQIQRSFDAAEADVGAATGARDAVRVTVVAETTRAYLEMCSAGREILIARSQVDLQAQSTGLTRRLATNGRASSVDVARSSAQEEQIRATIPTLLAQKRVAWIRLAALTGKAPQELPRQLEDCVQEPLLGKPLPVGDGASLLKRRPDIRRAEFEALSAGDRIGVAKADLYPKVALGASIASVGTLEHAFRDDSFKFSLGPLITWEFPDRTRAHARIHTAEAEREAALARFDGVVLSALKETESALEVYARDQERWATLQAARTQAQQAAQDTQRLYESGRIGYLAVLDALRTLATVEQSVAAAQTRVAADQVSLFLALGGGWGDVAQRS